jgi:hypothetical protein
MASGGLRLLEKSVLSLLEADRDWSVFDGWEDKKYGIMKVSRQEIAEA